MHRAPSATGPRDTVLPVSRLLAGVIAPILATAFVMLYVLPGYAGLLFAWPIEPAMMAMMLGATYVGGAYFFFRAFKATEWHTVHLGILPVSTFAGILGLSTVLHWERFTHWHPSFWLWVVLYFTLPFVLPTVYVINTRANRGPGPRPGGPTLPGALAIMFGLLGTVLVSASLMFLLRPDVMIPTWPWVLDPLTSRIMSAMFALAGLVGLGVAIDRRWTAARIPLEAQAVSILLFLAAMALFARGDIAWSGLASWAFLGGLVLVLVLIAVTFAWAARTRASTLPTGARPEHA